MSLESIINEQARKLYTECDVAGRGYVEKDDLQAAYDLLDPHQMKMLEEEIGEQRLKENEFVDLVSSVLTREQTESTGISLADEVQIANKRSTPIHDPLVDMIRKQLEDQSYPFSVENSAAEHIPTISQRVDYAKKPQFRPMEVGFQNEVTAATSLADELHEAEEGFSAGIRPAEPGTPDRIFKVVFVGDSAVGKTCFLHRFCHNRFKPLFNATIGVDFTVKSMLVGDRTIALQLWDTAGQERFRSITKQYFRKADGVMLMFDVTSEQSFLHVRNWIESVKACVDQETVMTLIGNKVDLFGDDSARSAVYTAARRLAQEFTMPFFETSAYTGFGIELTMRNMAERLQQREMDHLEAALRLEMEPTVGRRSWCCL